MCLSHVYSLVYECIFVWCKEAAQFSFFLPWMVIYLALFDCYLCCSGFPSRRRQQWRFFNLVLEPPKYNRDFSMFSGQIGSSISRSVLDQSSLTVLHTYIGIVSVSYKITLLISSPGEILRTQTVRLLTQKAHIIKFLVIQEVIESFIEKVSDLISTEIILCFFPLLCYL